MTPKSSLSVFNIPSGQSFARVMARHFLDQYQDTPEQLAAITILLPTRRACRTFQESFLQESAGKPVLLPKIQPLGDIDEQDLSLSLAGSAALDEILSLPPAITPLERRIILARTIVAMGAFTTSFDQALALADALAGFLDQIIIEKLDIARLADIVPEEFAQHWQITLDFLKILSEVWPNILHERGMIDSAERRNRLMHILAEHWRITRPEAPIYAAGSTGSIPATAGLLKVIAGLPHGHVILPGLDKNMPQHDWDYLAPSHPQYGLKQLLQHLEIDRDAVQNFVAINQDSPRIIAAREIMRPAETSSAWTQIAQNNAQRSTIENALTGLRLIEAANQREESLMIALEFRKILEEPRKTAILITPDRKLARRVSGHCKRWGIEVDDSAGQKLSQSPIGIYLSLLCEAAQSQITPRAFLNVLKHDFCRAGYELTHYQNLIHDLEYHALRGLKPESGFAGLFKRLNEKHHHDLDHLTRFLTHIEPIMAPFITMMSDGSPHSFAELLDQHLALAEALANTDTQSGATRLWRGEAGEAAAKLLSEISLHSAYFQNMDGATYLRVISHFMAGVTVRPRYGTHPRLSILGQLEARLIDADLIILGSLNEGSWPPDPGHDPWMSRPMRQSFGLPAPDRAIGLAAHDFVQGFCAPAVMMTRAKAIDGTMSVPARWLQRLDTVLQAAGLDIKTLHDPALHYLAKTLDRPDHNLLPIKRPEYAPPVEKRPKKLSVTKIETWMRDPYAIYAREILKLKKLDEIEKTIDAAERGTLLHAVMERFVKEHKDHIPDNAPEILNHYAQKCIREMDDDPAIWSFWWPRFHRIADWVSAHEHQWRSEAKARPLALEAEGAITLQAGEAHMTLSGKLDRIDLLADGTCAIIDYKSGGSYSATKIESGELPQLPLEALMLEQGAFAAYGITGKSVAMLQYWVMTGGHEAGKIDEFPSARSKLSMQEVIDQTRSGLEAMIEAFSKPETAYICLPKSHAQPRFNDYAHLERIQEWAALEDEDDFSESEVA